MRAADRALYLRPARVWDGVADGPVADVGVLVRDGRVVEVGSEVRHGRDAELVELPDCTLLPGLIDCHVHTLDESLDTQPAAYQVLRALESLRALLAGGFTTVRDLGGSGQPLNTALKRAIEEGIVVGPRMVVAPNIISARGGHADKSPNLSQRYGLEIGAVADGPDELRSAVRRQVRAGADWIKFAGGGGFSSPADGPTTTAYSQHEVTTLVTTARDCGLPTAVHAFDDESVIRAVRAGVHSVEHASLATPTAFRCMEKAGTYLVPTQYMAWLVLEKLDDDAYWEGRPAVMRETIERHAEGLRETLLLPARSRLKIAFGTDAGMFPHSENWRELPTMVKHGMSPSRALRAATSTAAEMLGLPDLGRIAPGAVADLVAVKGDPFQDIHAIGQVFRVVQAGRVCDM